MKSPDNLKCEYLVNPLGIQTAKPRFSWICRESDGEYCKVQSAYQIVAASTLEGLVSGSYDLWNSGKVCFDENAQIYYRGKKLSFGMECYWRCRIWDEMNRQTEWSEPAHFSMGFMDKSDVKAEFISCDIKRDADGIVAPTLLAKTFELLQNVKPKRAMVYMTALGVYEGYLNGMRMHTNLLAPEWTNYWKRVQYQVYDVTELLKIGANELKVYLGNGWYSSIWQDWPPRAHLYGEIPELLFQMELEYEDGSRQIVISDDSWKGTSDIPLRFSDIYEGEKFDARISEPYLGDNNTWKNVSIQKHPNLILTDQKSEPIQVTQHVKAQSITKTERGTYVVDFGQNLAGRLVSKFRVPEGTEILIKHNEMLNPDGTVYMDNLYAGRFADGRDRQILRYIANGKGEEVYRPHFTYMGFRYVEIFGLSYEPSVDDFCAEVIHTNMAFGSVFETSNKELNRLQENICWSQRSNMMGVPTDCPQRDERCGYTGDMNFFTPTALYNSNIAAFMNKWLIDLCQDALLPDGSYADHAPYFGRKGGIVGWGDAAIICTYLTWRAYGDVENIRNHYDNMKIYTGYLMSTANEDGTRKPEYAKLGDWLNKGGGASREVISTAYYGYHFWMMTQMAEAIGETKDAQEFKGMFQKVKKAFAKEYISADGTIKESSLTGYALAFTMELVPEKLYEKCVDAYIEETGKFGYRIATGFIGTPRILPALHRIGRDDVAEKMLLCRECPSWLYPVTVGATTVWERWDGWTEDKGFADRGMNSFNHFAFGSVGEYFFSGVLGVEQALNSVAYRSVVISPAFLKNLNYAKGGFETIRGRVEVFWERVEDRIHMQVRIPVGMDALIRLPSSAVEVTLGGEYIKDIHYEYGIANIYCSQGLYEMNILISE